MPRIEFLQDFDAYRPGQVVDFDHPGAAAILFERGIARPADADGGASSAPIAGIVPPAPAVAAKAPKAPKAPKAAKAPKER